MSQPELAAPHSVSPQVPTPAPKLDVVQEIRFAVVMYGGVSLAIYMNGVTQELLSLARATAYSDGNDPRAAGALRASELEGTDGIYRKLAYLAGSPKLRAEYRKWLADGRQGKSPADACIGAAAPVSTRFVIDVLSGTSAGGINAIFLAKALAKDKQLDSLKKLWVEEGDLGRLINDKASLDDSMSNVQLVQPPRALLNSQRMYFKLLGAFNGVDESRQDLADTEVSPYLDEIDLYVTTTDIHGVTLPLRLSDRVVYEKRHRNVFHFRYGAPYTLQPRDDFTRGHNPFLAFAARCTSSFPFAFEPMCLQDVDLICKTGTGLGNGNVSQDARWPSYFTESLGDPPENGSLDFVRRPFGDGGYLDNKPFTYVTETLATRFSDVPVRRKLLYIEPSPEHPEDEDPELGRPNALANVYAAVLDLPRQETIREDLQRLLDRNRLIDRADRTLDQARNDIAEWKRELSKGAIRENWRTLYLPDVLKGECVAYIPYWRMRIADATDQLAQCLTRTAGFDVKSDAFLAVRALMHVWRVAKYADHPNEAGLPSTNEFLDDLDIGFRVRRMTYVRRQIDMLHRVSDASREELDDPRAHTEIRTVYKFLKDARYDYDKTERSTFKQALRTIKRSLNKVEHGLQLEFLRLEGRSRAAARDIKDLAPPLAPLVAKLRLSRLHLKYILGLEWNDAWSSALRDGNDPGTPPASAPYARAVTNEEREKRARTLFDNPQKFGLDGSFRDDLQALADTLKAKLRTIFDNSFDGVRAELEGGFRPRTRSTAETVIADFLWNEFLLFERYDQVTFPILYGTDVGESEPVEIFRVSPEDATALIDERGSRPPRRKLAGTSLFNFGGFLDRAWRENDIMWGRLDGAERLITAVLPDAEDADIRRHLIEQAHEVILSEVESDVLDDQLGDAISKSLFREEIAKTEDLLRSEPSAKVELQKKLQTLTAIVNGRLSGKGLMDELRSRYRVDRRLDPKPVLQWVARSTQVIGHMFEEIAREARGRENAKHLAWIARFGSLFWGLVQVAVPGSMGNLFFRHWIKVLVVFETLVLAGGLVLNHDGAAHFGWLSLSLTLLVWIVVTVLGDIMQLKRGWLYASFGTLVLALVAFALIGVDHVFDLKWFPFLQRHGAELMTLLSR